MRISFFASAFIAFGALNVVGVDEVFRLIFVKLLRGLVVETVLISLSDQFPGSRKRRIHSEMIENPSHAKSKYTGEGLLTQCPRHRGHRSQTSWRNEGLKRLKKSDCCFI